MLKHTAILLTLLLGGAVLAVQENQSLHKHNKQELLAKIEKTQEKDRAQLYAEMAHVLVETANDQYTANDFDKALETVKKIVEYSDKSTQLALANEKHIKRVEIELRETARRLNEIKHTIGIDDQPPLTEAADKIEKMRRDLFDKMFGKKK